MSSCAISAGHRSARARWSTRIIALPGAPFVSTGTYRFLSHPNYLVVIGKIAVLPLCFGLPLCALAFSIANLGLLASRVRAENESLTEAVTDKRRQLKPGLAL
jgi:methyltransferase